jgi:hypothetical protein
VSVRFLRCVALGSLVVALACGGGDDDAGYSPELRKQFVTDCTDGGTSKAICGCYYDRLEAEVPFDRFQELDQALRDATSEVPEEIQDMVVDCALQAEDS